MRTPDSAAIIAAYKRRQQERDRPMKGGLEPFFEGALWMLGALTQEPAKDHPNPTSQPMNLNNNEAQRIAGAVVDEHGDPSDLKSLHDLFARAGQRAYKQALENSRTPGGDWNHHTGVADAYLEAARRVYEVIESIRLNQGA